ncbi:MAG: cobalamin-independent methionine synthase II family protein [Candidatus Binatus sp.]|uniref:cobalamin-independent methionine synthase II family protein n=1 Tax=Candidatus Binatus sp. TaxID=2811406 RepID=UPI00271C75A7|nr:cobalamin-independent methionine synthase II family protein [Candidatus Binatus sp.]MDO8434252.1 cobalamin-independent methionine synthase II family protein [Candidatus Binatus sp.]
MDTILMPTTVVGSYPQPDWLINRESLGKQVPRMRAPELWRIAEPWLEQAQDDATIVAIHEMEAAGIDIVTDGEMRRESYSNRFANSLDGIDTTRAGKGAGRLGSMTFPVPLVTGRIRRPGPVEVRDLKFLRAHTARKIKITLPGPFTMAHQNDNQFYPDREQLAMDLALAVNEEIKDLFAAGADVVQIDEPWMEARAEQAKQYGVSVVNRALEGVRGTTALHMCFGYAHVMPAKPSAYSFLSELEGSIVQQISIETAQPKIDLAVLKDLPSKTIILGVIDLKDLQIETPETVAGRIEKALKFVAPERLVIAPDCGMKYLPRERAFGKLKAMVEGARLVRSTL